ncbi:unnamed protein product [Calicophoron daubneyi]|uniref:BZIP domain-containing protein n=1 Tax=Calicophoron daubneyi TaxID=300641 RepID=A0AAV2T1Z6_CALDB
MGSSGEESNLRISSLASVLKIFGDLKTPCTSRSNSDVDGLKPDKQNVMVTDTTPSSGFGDQILMNVTSASEMRISDEQKPLSFSRMPTLVLPTTEVESLTQGVSSAVSADTHSTSLQKTVGLSFLNSSVCELPSKPTMSTSAQFHVDQVPAPSDEPPATLINLQEISKSSPGNPLVYLLLCPMNQGTGNKLCLKLPIPRTQQLSEGAVPNEVPVNTDSSPAPEMSGQSDSNTTPSDKDSRASSPAAALRKRNREAARRSRNRKRQHVLELEDRIADLTERLSQTQKQLLYMTCQNKVLRELLASQSGRMTETGSDGKFTISPSICSLSSANLMTIPNSVILQSPSTPGTVLLQLNPTNQPPVTATSVASLPVNRKQPRQSVTVGSVFLPQDGTCAESTKREVLVLRPNLN